ncbi:MAG: chromosome segregation protein SMC [Oscillospiraceae bacterium]|jgi:chromosome segregation protein|nr:chromosome segregation protein SMC [Oscillospiraceae bacterium]
MKLKRLEIIGFKSFADKTELLVGSGITGVVGPNGSGKSNISDAVRWVLGETSARQLRGASMADVIFNGSQKRKPLPWCEVTVVLDNEDGTLPIETSEVALTRRVYRDGVSEAMLGRAPCRMKDITQLLRDTGLGREGYAIIGQGRVDEILSAKPEERRRAFEEAAGIITFRERKEEAAKRLEDTQHNIERINDIVFALDEQLMELEAQSRVAKEYVAVHSRLRGLELLQFVREEDKRASQIKQFSSNNQQTVALIENLRLEMQSLSDKKETVSAGLGDSEARLELMQADRIEAARAQERLAGELARVTLSIEHEKGEEARAESLGVELERRVTELEDSKNALAESSDVIAALLRDFQTKREETAAEAERLREEENKRAGELEEHKTKTLEALNRLSESKTRGARLSAMRETLEAHILELEASLEECQSRSARFELDIKQAEAETKAAEERFARIAEKKSDIQGDISNAERNLAVIRRASQEHFMSIKAAETRLTMLRELRDSYEGYQNAVRAVLRMRGKAGSGVIGAVADIMDVPEHLEAALETVLGGALQNIVVEDENAAKRLIEYLRQNRLGRATFLPLTTVSGRTLSNMERGVLNLPGCVGVAAELVRFDKRYQNIVDSLLGRTVVADDMDAGLAIMRQGRFSFRTVTLLGDVLNQGGSMTGGSAQGKSANLLSRSRELERQQKQYEELQLRAVDIKKEEPAKILEINELRRLLEEHGTLLRAEEIAMAEAAMRKLNAVHALENGKAQASDILEKLARERETLVDVLEQQSAGVKVAETDEDPQALQLLTPILIKKRDDARLAAEAAADKLTGIRIELSSREKELGEARRNIERLTADAARYSNERKALDAQVISAKNKLSEYSSEQKAIKLSLLICEENETKLTSELEALFASVKEARHMLSEIAVSESAKRMEIADLTERSHKFEMSVARLDEERKAAADRIWNSYELTYAGAGDMIKDLPETPVRETERLIDELKEQIRAMGSVNVGALELYQQTKEKRDELDRQRSDLDRAKADLETLTEQLIVHMKRQFVEQMKKLNSFFSDTFRELFGGGAASLVLQDEANALECGIDVLVTPPGKRQQMLSLLSGGERALTAIAILLAMLKLKPSPFCVLDEIDSALDEANVVGFAKALQRFAADTQFIVLTHRKGTMERCEALFGVTMAERGVSKVISVSMSGVAEYARENAG